MFPIDEFVPTAEMLNAKTFPRGIQFKPSGEQLIEDFLLPWAKGEKLEWEGIVEKQMYGENFPCEPWKVFSDIESAYHSRMEEKDAIKYTVYAFTKLIRPSNSKRVSRRAGEGTWDGQTGPRKIQNSETGCIVGQSKMLTYVHRGEADVGHWTLHEYCLSSESVKKSGRSNAADFVVCKVTKTVKKKPIEAHVPVPVPIQIPASPTVSMKRGAEVDLLRNGEDSDMKRLKFDGGEFSGARPDWMKEYGDMFPSEFHQLMEAETANEAPFANPGVFSTLEPYYSGYEALPVPVPVPASETMSMKRAAEVDLLNEEDSDLLIDLKQLEDMLGF